MTEQDVDELVRGLDKEEKEMYEGDNEDDNEESDKVLRDVKELEVVLEEELKEVVNLAKPVCQVLYKVSLVRSSFFILDCHLFIFFGQYPSPLFFFSILLFTRHLSSSSFFFFFYFLFHPRFSSPLVFFLILIAIPWFSRSFFFQSPSHFFLFFLSLLFFFFKPSIPVYLCFLLDSHCRPFDIAILFFHDPHHFSFFSLSHFFFYIHFLRCISPFLY